MKYELYTTAELPDFDSLRGYIGKSGAVVISGLSGDPGLFSYDPTDTSSTDDGVDLIVGNDGRRWVRISLSPDSIDAAVASAVAAAETAEANAETAEANAEAAQLAAETAEDNAILAAATSGVYGVTAASNVPRGLTQASVGAITAGSGGTNGTFALAWSAGNFTINPTGTFTVAGGALTAVTITGPGLYIGASPTVPTPSFAASAGLTGAAVALTAQFLVTSGQGYWVQSTDGNTLTRYRNVSGVATLDSTVGSIPTAAYLTDNVEVLAAEVRESIGPVNLFDKANCEDNAVLPNGTATTASPAAGYFVTNFIPVQAGGYITSNQATVAGYNVHLYDAGRNLLSNPAGLVASTPYLVPAGVAYVRATFQRTTSGGRQINTKHDLVIVQGQTLPTYYMPFGRPEAYPLWRQMQIEAYDFPLRNIHNIATTVNGQTFDANGASTADAGKFFTDYIPVVPGDTYTVYAGPVANNVLNGGVPFYDIDKGFMYFQDPLIGITQVTVPAACYWMKLSRFIAQSTVANLQVYRGTSTPVVLSRLTPVMKGDTWAGKNWFVQGDSRTDETYIAGDISPGWIEQVAAYHGATVSQNAALFGRYMVDALKKRDGTALASGDFTNIDMALLALGINDHNALTTMGTIADSTATASFYGYTKLFVETVLGWKPTLRLVIATPMRQTATPGPRNPDPINYVTALRAVAALYGLPVLDLYALSGFNAISLPSFSADGLHPNAAGHLAGQINPAIGFFKSCLPTT